MTDSKDFKNKDKAGKNTRDARSTPPKKHDPWEFIYAVRRPVRVSKRTPSEDFPLSTRGLF